MDSAPSSSFGSHFSKAKIAIDKIYHKSRLFNLRSYAEAEAEPNFCFSLLPPQQKQQQQQRQQRTLKIPDPSVG